MNSQEVQINPEQARRLRALWEQKRVALNLSIPGAARTLGCSQLTVINYLRGRIPLGTQTVLKCAEFLGVSPGDIAPLLARFVAYKMPKKTKLPVYAAPSFRGQALLGDVPAHQSLPESHPASNGQTSDIEEP